MGKGVAKVLAGTDNRNEHRIVDKTIIASNSASFLFRHAIYWEL